MGQTDVQPPPPHTPDASAFQPAEYPLPIAGIAEPAVGAAAGALRVTESTPYSLELRGRNLSAIILTIGGLALFGAFAGILVFQMVRMVNGEPFDVHWFMILALLVGLGAIISGVFSIGVSYRFDGRARTLYREMLFGLVGKRTWQAHEVQHLRVKIASGKEDAWSGRERLLAMFMGQNGKPITFEYSIFGTPPTQSMAAETAARAAIAGARLLKVPVVVEGVVVKGRKELAAMLTPA